MRLWSTIRPAFANRSASLTVITVPPGVPDIPCEPAIPDTRRNASSWFGSIALPAIAVLLPFTLGHVDQGCVIQEQVHQVVPAHPHGFRLRVANLVKSVERLRSRFEYQHFGSCVGRAVLPSPDDRG